MQLLIGRRHWSPSNCQERDPWQYSCSNQSCRLCFMAPLDLRGQVRMSASGLLGWELILKVGVAWVRTVGGFWLEKLLKISKLIRSFDRFHISIMLYFQPSKMKPISRFQN